MSNLKLGLEQFTMAKFKRKVFDSDKLKKGNTYNIKLDFRNNINDFIYKNAFYRKVSVDVYNLATHELLVSFIYDNIRLFLSDWKIKKTQYNTPKVNKFIYGNYICTILPAYENGMYISVRNTLNGSEEYKEIPEVDFNKSIKEIIEDVINKSLRGRII